MEFDSINFLAIGLIFLGSYVQTAIGFGLAIVAAPLLILWAPEYVPAPICLVALFISLMNAMNRLSQRLDLLLLCCSKTPHNALSIGVDSWYPSKGR